MASLWCHKCWVATRETHFQISRKSWWCPSAEPHLERWSSESRARSVSGLPLLSPADMMQIIMYWVVHSGWHSSDGSNGSFEPDVKDGSYGSDGLFEPDGSDVSNEHRWQSQNGIAPAILRQYLSAPPKTLSSLLHHVYPLLRDRDCNFTNFLLEQFSMTYENLSGLSMRIAVKAFRKVRKSDSFLGNSTRSLFIT